MSSTSLDQIAQTAQQALAELAGISNTAALDEFRVKYLGRKGVFTQARASIGTLPKEQRGQAGKVINDAFKQVENAFK